MKPAACSIAFTVRFPITSTVNSTTAFYASASRRIGSLAGTELRGLERHLRDLAHVVPDRRQGPARANALDEPFLARHPLRHCARPDDFADSARVRHF